MSTAAGPFATERRQEPDPFQSHPVAFEGPEPRPKPHPLTWVSLGLVVAFATAIGIGNTPANIILAVLAVSALPVVVATPGLRTHPIIIASLALPLYVLAMAVLAEFDGAPGEHLGAIDNYAFLALAPAVAVHGVFALRTGVPFARLSVILLIGIVGGTGFRLFFNADWAAGLDLFAAYARGGGGGNRNYMSILAGCMILGTSTLAVIALAARNRVWVLRFLLAAAALFVMALALLALVAMESRTNLVATAVATAVWAIVLIVAMRRWGRLRLRWVAAAGLVVLGLAAIAGWLYAPEIAGRLTANGGLAGNIEVFASILTGSADRAALDLEAYDPRVYVFFTARELIAEKPRFGWGPDVAPLVGAHIGVERWAGLFHFHNAVLEFLVGVGIVGTLLILAHAGLLIAGMRPKPVHRLDGVAGPALTAMIAGVLVYFALVAMTESANRMEFVTQTLILVFAMLLARAAIGRAMEPAPPQ